MTRARTLFGTVVLGSAIASTSLLMATTVIPMSVEDLTSAASDVVEARAGVFE